MTQAIELTTTRANDLIDPVLHVWAWQIPVYLFLGGLVAGLMVLGGWRLVHPSVPGHASRRTLPFVAIILLSAGMLALFLDLEHKWYVWRLYFTLQWTSPMSWGAWILVAVYPVLGAMTWLGAEPSPHAKRLGAIAIGLGVLLGVYTGILLSSLAARPAWNSALLGPLFLASGASSAAALSVLLVGDHDERAWLERVDTRLLVIEIALLALFLIGQASASRAHKAAAALFLGGSFTAALWVGVIGIGLVLPLGLQWLVERRRLTHSVVPPLLVLAGGVLLRFVIVAAGQASAWPAF